MSAALLPAGDASDAEDVKTGLNGLSAKSGQLKDSQTSNDDGPSSGHAGHATERDGIDDPATGTNGNSQAQKLKRSRSRRPASCTACRKKKFRCDRLLPCETCKQRGVECTYDGGAEPLHIQPQADGTAELKLQVDRLKELVEALSRNAAPKPVEDADNESRKKRKDDLPTPPLPKDVRQHTADNDVSSFGTPEQDSHNYAYFSSPGQQGESGKVGRDALRKMNLKALDICEALGQLSVSGVIRLDGSQPHNVPLMQEARAALGNAGHHTVQPRLGTFPFTSSPDSIDKIMAILPTLTQAETVITCFKRQLSWYIYFFPWSSFDEQWSKLRSSTTQTVDCSFLSIFLAVCGIGLYFLPEKQAGDFPSGPGKLELSNAWFDASASALTLARFLDCPSLNTIHAMQLLTAWHVYLSPGDTSSTGFAILNIASEAVLQLGLHRDPDPAHYTPFEINTRRLTFWQTVMLETQAGSSLGKTWSLFQLQHCDTKLPIDKDEDAFLPNGYPKEDYVPSGEPNMVSILLRMRVAIVSKRISERAFSIQDVSFSTVLELDRELHQVEDSFPPQYRIGLKDGQLDMPKDLHRLARLKAHMVNVGLLQEYIRLHRPFVASGSSFEVCRTSCIRAARITMGIFKELAVFNYGGLTFKAMMACCVICMDLISHPNYTEAEAMRQDVAAVVALLDKNKDRSKLAANGVRIIRFLLAKSAPTPMHAPAFPGPASTINASQDSQVPPEARARDGTQWSSLSSSASSRLDTSSSGQHKRHRSDNNDLRWQDLAPGVNGTAYADPSVPTFAGAVPPAYMYAVPPQAASSQNKTSQTTSLASLSSMAAPPTPSSFASNLALASSLAGGRGGNSPHLAQNQAQSYYQQAQGSQAIPKHQSQNQKQYMQYTANVQPSPLQPNSAYMMPFTPSPSSASFPYNVQQAAGYPPSTSTSSLYAEAPSSASQPYFPSHLGVQMSPPNGGASGSVKLEPDTAALYGFNGHNSNSTDYVSQAARPAQSAEHAGSASFINYPGNAGYASYQQPLQGMLPQDASKIMNSAVAYDGQAGLYGGVNTQMPGQGYAYGYNYAASGQQSGYQNQQQ